LTALLKRQYEGFLRTPQIFKNTALPNARIFETNEIIDINLSEKNFAKLEKHKFLGKRAEYFLLDYLESCNRYTNVLHSYQIHSEEKTIGELDFVCFDLLQQKWIHIELVFKLYVFTGDNQYDDFSHWIGPNLKDRLDYKIKKLKSHQIPLGQHKSILSKTKATEIESYICYKAKLFLKNTSVRLKSSKINQDCISGTYINIEEFKLLKHQKSLFYVPKKMDWICAATSNKHWYSFEKAEENLKLGSKEKRAKLVWQKTENGLISEYFVVWW